MTEKGFKGNQLFIIRQRITMMGAKKEATVTTKESKINKRTKSYHDEVPPV